MFFQEATPDTSGYMIAGYAIAFLVMALYVVTIYLRSRNQPGHDHPAGIGKARPAGPDGEVQPAAKNHGKSREQ